MPEHQTLRESVGLETDGPLPIQTISKSEKKISSSKLNPEYLIVVATRLARISNELQAKIAGLTSGDTSDHAERSEIMRFTATLSAVRHSLRELISYSPTLSFTNAVTNSAITLCRSEIRRIDVFLGFEPGPKKIEKQDDSQ